jgi:hypothetical protein
MLCGSCEHLRRSFLWVSACNIIIGKLLDGLLRYNIMTVILVQRVEYLPIKQEVAGSI